MATATNLRRRRLSAPSAAYIAALVEESNAQSSRIRRRWETIRAVRNGDYEMEIPPAYQKWTKHIKTRRIGDIIGRVTATVTHGFPTVAVPPSGPSNKAQTESTTREKFLNASLQAMDSQAAPERAFIQAMDNAVTYGFGCWKFLYTAEDWWDYPTARNAYDKRVIDLTEEEEKGLTAKREEYKKGRLPFRWQAVDPFTLWLFRRGGRIAEAIEVSTRTVADIMRRYNVGWDPISQKISPEQVGEPHSIDRAVETQQRTVTFVEHWDEQYVTYLALEGQVVLAQWQHGYKRVPYFPFYGKPNYSQPSGQRGESVVEHVVELEQALDMFLTLKANWAYMTAMAMLTLQADSNAPYWQQLGPEGASAEQAPEPIRFEPGVAKAVPPGWALNAFMPPPVGQDLNDSIQFLNGMLQDVLPQVLRGIASGSDQPGYAINQLMNAARLVFDPITDNGAEALMDMVSFFLQLIETKAKTTVYVLAEEDVEGTVQRQWIGLGPEEINHYYANLVSLKSLLPSNLIAEGQFGLSLWQAGAIDHATFLEKYAQFANPEEIIVKVLVDEFRKSEPIRNWVMAQALKAAGMDEEIRQAQEEAALAGIELPPGIAERLALAGQPPGLPNLAPMPGQGMPQVPPEPTMPVTVGAAMPGGRAAGMGIQPNTQMLPGGIPTNS